MKETKTGKRLTFLVNRVLQKLMVKHRLLLLGSLAVPSTGISARRRSEMEWSVQSFDMLVWYLAHELSSLRSNMRMFFRYFLRYFFHLFQAHALQKIWKKRKNVGAFWFGRYVTQALEPTYKLTILYTRGFFIARSPSAKNLCLVSAAWNAAPLLRH